MNLFEMARLIGSTACEPDVWQTTIRLACGMPLEPELVPVAREICGHGGPWLPNGYRKICVVAGRGSAKTDNINLLAVHGAVFGDVGNIMRPGRRIWQGIAAQSREVAVNTFEGCIAIMRQLEDVLEQKLIESSNFGANAGIIYRADSNLGIRILTRDPEAARGFQFLDVFIDEAGAGAVGDESAKSVGRFEQSVRPRVSGRTWLVGTPGQFEGPLYRAYERDRRPEARTLYVSFPTWLGSPAFDRLNPGVRQEMLETDQPLHDREFGAKWIQLEGAWLDAGAIARAMRKGPAAHPWEAGRSYFAAADHGFKNDSSVLVIGSHDYKRPARVDFIHELRPARGAPLSPTDVTSEFADDLARYRVSTVIGDAFYELALQEAYRNHGVSYETVSFAPADKLRMFSALRAALLESALELPPLDRMASQLRETRLSFTQSGTARFSVPERKGHDDIAVCVAMLAERMMRELTRAPYMPPVQFEDRQAYVERTFGLSTTAEKVEVDELGRAHLVTPRHQGGGIFSNGSSSGGF